MKDQCTSADNPSNEGGSGDAAGSAFMPVKLMGDDDGRGIAREVTDWILMSVGQVTDAGEVVMAATDVPDDVLPPSKLEILRGRPTALVVSLEGTD